MKRNNYEQYMGTQKAIIRTRTISIILFIAHILLIVLLYLSNYNLPFALKVISECHTAQNKGNSNIFINRSKVFLVYHSGSSYIDPIDPNGKRCLIPWKYTRNINEAQLIMYNALDNYGSISSKRNLKTRPDQITCVESMESATNYKAIDTNRRNFDYSMTYSLTSDVPIPYSEFFETSEMPLNLSEKKDYFICAFISNCGAANNRTNYVKELMEYVKIDSFGSCLKNAKTPISFKRKNRYRTKEAMLSRYKFTIAFENSNDADYITEKLYQPLRYGSVPIFRGCSNLEDFVPPHSAIDANKFNSPKELADYLNYLNQNDTAYNEYLQWKYDHNYGNLAKIRFFRDRYEYGVCALVERIHGLWINPYLTDWKRVTDAETMCNKCLDDFDLSNRRIPILREDGWTYDYPLGEFWSNVLNMTNINTTVKKVEKKQKKILLKEIKTNITNNYLFVDKILSVFSPFV